VFCLMCLGALAVTVMIQGSFAMSDEEIEAENSSYHDQQYTHLVARKNYGKSDYVLVLLHIACEMINSSFPAGRNTTLWKNMYFPRVDAFTELRSNFTQSVAMIPNTTVRVWLEIPAQGLRSESRVVLYNYNDTKGHAYDRIVGSRAITVNMEEGIITDMFWDDSCTGCIEDLCMEDSCSSVISDLRPSCQDKAALEEDPFRCGIKIYIAWKGTDKSNTTLTSFTSVPSRFQKYSFVASAYDAAAGFSSDFISFWKQPLN